MTCDCPTSHSPAEKPSCCSTHHPMKQPHKVLVTHGNATRHHAGRKKGRKTHTSIPLILHSTLFGMRLIKEGWFHLLAPGPEVTDRSSEVTDRSWLNHSHNNAAERMSPPTRRFAKEGKRSGSYMTSPINPYISLLTYMTRDCRPARPNTVSHPYFCKDTAHETSHVCVFKKILTFQ